MRRRSWIILVLIVLLIGGGAGYYFWYRPAHISDSDRQSNGAQTVTVSKGDVLNSITVYGEVIPQQEYTYTFDGGQVDEILVSTGARVGKGDVLVKLDSERKKLSMLQAEQALKEARAEGAKSIIEQKELAYQIAKEEYEETTLKAEFSGVVTEVNQATTSSEAWSITLIDTSQLYIEAEVNQLDVPSLEEGQEAETTVEPLSDKSWQVEIVEIGGMAVNSGNSKVVKIKAELPKLEAPVLPGYTAQMSITTSSAYDVLRVPISALSETPRGWAVMKVTSEGTTPQQVQVGVTADQYAEITSGLSEGDRILLYPSGQARPSSQSEKRDRPSPPGGGFSGGGLP